MKCPACSNHLAELTNGELTVDVYRHGGIWFDNFRTLDPIPTFEVRLKSHEEISKGRKASF